MSIKTEVWGKSPKGKDVHKFTMTNAMGASVTVMPKKMTTIKYISKNAAPPFSPTSQGKR